MEELSDDNWAPMMNLIDNNHDGKISLGEYEDFYNKQMGIRGNIDAQVELGLTALDSDNDGNLDQANNDNMEHIQNEPWAKRTLTKTNPVKTNPVKTNPDQNEPWSKQTLSKTDPGQNEPCQKQTLVKTNPGQNEP